jgi:hypothetical protein
MAETVGTLRPSLRVFMMPPDKKKKRGKKNWNLIYQFIDARSRRQASTISGTRIVIPSVARNLLLLGPAKISRGTGENAIEDDNDSGCIGVATKVPCSHSF